MFMSEISFQAIPFVPRLLSEIALISLTWLVAKYAKWMVLRAANQNIMGHIWKGLFLKISNISFWVIILLCSPFILGATGLDASWLRRSQLFLGQLFFDWPIWMLISLIIAGAIYLLLNIPKFYILLKGSVETSPNEFK
jgi:hypothetical protein